MVVGRKTRQDKARWGSQELQHCRSGADKPVQDTQGWRYLTCPLLGGMVEGSVQSYTGG